MNKRTFRLASLLRLRRLQEDQAAIELAKAAAERLRASERAERHHRDLAGHRTPGITSAAGWTASVAARAALSAASRQAAAEAATAADRADAATSTWQDARRDTAALERLEERHDAEVAADRLRAEQLHLDEHAAAHRGDEDVTP